MARRSTAALDDEALPPDMSRRERNKARTRTAILEASISCMAESGVQDATMDQIAAAADVARATLFNYFPSKNDIIEALVAENDAGFFVAIEGWRRATHLTTVEKLAGLFAATDHYLRRAPARRRAVLSMSWRNWGQPGNQQRVQRVVDAFTALLEDGRHGGDLSPQLDSAIAGEIIAQTYMGVIHAWRMDEAHPAANRLDVVARLLSTMIAPGTPFPDRAPLPPIPTQPEKYT
jgi:AcrR family transcriptional regulator